MKKKKPYIRYLLVLLVCFIFYRIFKSSLQEIFSEVCTTKASIILAVSIAAVLYHIMEGRITYLLARQHTKDYSFVKGIKNSFYASFYRVITFGSGGGVSAIYNLHLDGVPVESGIGLYFTGYVIHKIAILLYGLVIITFRFPWIKQYFSEYKNYFVAGYAIGIVVAVILVLLCISPVVYKLAHYLIEMGKQKFIKKQTTLEELDGKLLALQKESKVLLTDKTLFLKLLFDNLIKLTTYYMIPYLILYNSGSISPIDSVSLVAITYILSAAIPTPSGVGSIEAVYVILLVKFISKIDAAASMLLFRFATLLVPCMIGGIYVVVRNFLSLRKAKRFSHE